MYDSVYLQDDANADSASGSFLSRLGISDRRAVQNHLFNFLGRVNISSLDYCLLSTACCLLELVARGRQQQ